ncbi:MAG: TIM barrel protein [Fuerstiella sp.]|jgi:sugar phosphate isomerase/epimerase|nr:TIM barrel protein [Fuerstiella sp.]
MAIRRRDFLAASAAVAAVSPSVLTAGPATAAARMLKLGLVTYNWGREWDVPTVIRNCEATGFAGVELRSTHKHGVEISSDRKQRSEVRRLFEDSRVELVGLGSACEYHAVDPVVLRKNIDETKQFVRLCKDVGGTGVKVRPNGLPKERSVEQTLEQIGRSLNDVGRFAADYDVQIRVEVHGRGTSEIRHMQTIFEIADHPNVVVCWNCNPTDLAGDGLATNYRSLQKRMGTIHIHDLRNNKYPWEELFPLLQNTTADSFTGWALLEEGSVPQDIVPAMKENHERWKILTSA